MSLEEVSPSKKCNLRQAKTKATGPLGQGGEASRTDSREV